MEKIPASRVTCWEAALRRILKRRRRRDARRSGPTPAVAYLTRAQRLSAGVVISASHNPFYDNGIKFFSDKGTKLPDEMELQIEKEMDRGFSCVDSARLGKARRLDDAAGRYVEFCKSTFPSDLDLKGFKDLCGLRQRRCLPHCAGCLS